MHAAGCMDVLRCALCLQQLAELASVVCVWGGNIWVSILLLRS